MEKHESQVERRTANTFCITNCVKRYVKFSFLISCVFIEKKKLKALRKKSLGKQIAEEKFVSC